MRLNKYIADTGYCSRRKADELIESGKVKVNGKAPELGMQVTASDKITVNGKTLRMSTENITIALHKPAGTITSKSDPYHSQTLMDLLPKELHHLKPAGRLDKDSEGLLILSTDGELIQKLTHPKHEHSKLYEVIIKGYPKPEELRMLESGKLQLDGYTLNPMQFEIMGTLKGYKTRIKLTLNEGRKRQIRRIMDHLGFPVIYLRRIAIGRLELGDLPKGKYRELSPKDIENALS